MEIRYNAKSDLVYIRLDERKQDVANRRFTEDIVLDIGADNRIIGIEILDASKHLNLARAPAGQIPGVAIARCKRLNLIFQLLSSPTLNR